MLAIPSGLRATGYWKNLQCSRLGTQCPMQYIKYALLSGFALKDEEKNYKTGIELCSFLIPLRTYMKLVLFSMMLQSHLNFDEKTWLLTVLVSSGQLFLVHLLFPLAISNHQWLMATFGKGKNSLLVTFRKSICSLNWSEVLQPDCQLVHFQRFSNFELECLSL